MKAARRPEPIPAFTSEEKLAEARDRLKACVDLLDVAREGAWMVDEEGRTLYVNQRMAALLGFTREEMLGHRMTEYLAPEALSAEDEKITGLGTGPGTRLREPGASEHHKLHFVSRNGNDVWTHCVINALISQDGRCAGSLAMVTDLTEETLARNALQRKEKELELLFNSVPAAIWYKDTRNRILRCNLAAARLAGLRPDQIEGRPAEEAFPRFAREFYQDDLEVLRDGQPRFGQLTRFESAQSQSVWIQADRLPRFDDQGKVVGIAVLAIDVTRLKQAEDELRFLCQAGELLSSTLDLQQTLDTLTRLAVPRIADCAYVHLRDETGAPYPAQLRHRDPEKESLLRSLWQPGPTRLPRPTAIDRAIATGEPQRIEIVSDQMLAELAPTPRHLEIYREAGFTSAFCVPLLTGDRVLGTLSLYKSAADRHFCDEDLSLSQELARRAAAAIENARLYRQSQETAGVRQRLLAVVSHDLKNPISGIMANAMLLPRAFLTPAPEERVREHAQLIVRLTGHMNQLIRDLLDSDKIESGRLALDKAECDLHSLVEAAVELLRPLAQQRAIALLSVLPPENVGVVCDKERIMQVFSNLIGNAVKFSREGSQIRISAETRADDVLLGIQDQGPGIPPEQLPHIFDRYWQLQKTARLGTGLGLSIAREIVHAHGGQIWAESRMGEGSRFCFTLPRAG